MLIIAVVVAVTIGITKAKLDNIVSYTYYNAYSTLRKISTEMLADWKPQDPEYKQALVKKNLFAMFSKNVHAAFYPDVTCHIDNYCTQAGTFFQPSFCEDAGFHWCNENEHRQGDGCFTCCTPKCTKTCQYGEHQLDKCDCFCKYPCWDGSFANSEREADCPAYKCWDGSSTVKGPAGCPIKYTCWDGSYVTDKSKCPPQDGGNLCNKSCGSGYTLDKNSCTCKCTRSCGSGYKLNSSSCSCEKLPCTNKPSSIPCGQSWNESTCSLTGSVKTCSDGYSLDGNCNCVCTRSCGSGYKLNSSSCSCVALNKCWDGSYVENISNCPKADCWNGTQASNPDACPPKITCWDGTNVTNESNCPGYVTCWNGNKAHNWSECPACTNKPSKLPCGQGWDEHTCQLTGTAKTCPSGQHLNGSCNCVNDCPSNLSPCNICSDETGIVSQNPAINRTCSDEAYEWSEEQCKCIVSPRTLPRKGMNFCKLFERHANIMSGSSVCSGSVISNGTTDFSNKSPDITLRNGLRVYNMHSDAGAISMLANNTQGGVYDGVPNTNSYGYTVYVDIDGAKGDSQLWSDVYPFYITLSGKIIPAYDTSNANSSGGDSVRHLQVSVENENYTSGKRSTKWLAKSVPFKEGACISGYVGDATPYCKNGTSYTQASECTSNINSICRVKQIQPVKFFF